MDKINTTNHPEIIYATMAWYESQDGEKLVKEEEAKRVEMRCKHILEDPTLALELNSKMSDVSSSISEATKKGECSTEIGFWDWSSDIVWYIKNDLKKKGYRVTRMSNYRYGIDWHHGLYQSCQD